MKTIIAYDTETLGIPLWSLPSEHPDQPRVLQIAAELCEEETGETIEKLCYIIKPDGWIIPDEIQLLTGITMERANDEGVPIEFALNEFIELWKKSDLRVAHNESFDMRMIRIELMRHPVYSMAVIGEEPFADYWKKAPAFCTQGQSTKIVNLPPAEKMLAAKRKTPKSPNLGEAYLFFTGRDLEGAHDAGVDVMACKAVYYGIKNHLAKAA
jgi:DNA polymerase-3 subunit epsilon